MSDFAAVWDETSNMKHLLSIVLLVFLNVARITPKQNPKSVPNACRVDCIDILVNDRMAKDCGTQSDKNHWKIQPKVYPKEAKKEKSYTLIMFDPDVPEFAAPGFLHWLVSNIPGGPFKSKGVPAGSIVQPYFMPTPPQDSGQHNYFIYVFEQADKQQNVTYHGRINFDFDKWHKANPKLLGPIGGYCTNIAFEYNPKNSTGPNGYIFTTKNAVQLNRF